MADEFGLGDVVRLKSGRPAMTVSGERENGEFVVSWFDGTTLKMGQFPAHVLEKAPAPAGGGGPVVRQRS